jgi:hypothetical protein
MADWTSIPDATFDPDRPVLGSTHLAIVKNFEALAEGATGAPRVENAALDPIQTAIIADDAVTTAKLAVATRSFSGTVGNQTSTSISFTDNFAFAVRVTLLGDGLQVIIRQNSYLLSNPTEDNKSYALNWRYFNA